MMQLEVKNIGLFQSNCIVLHDTREAIVIDPGFIDKALIDSLDAAKLNVIAVLMTHGHIDHVIGVEFLKQKYPKIDLYIHEEDLFLYNNISMQAEYLGQDFRSVSSEINCFFKDNQVINLLNLDIQVIHTPGHSPGGVSFYFRKDSQPYLISGDTLFKSGIGRTDLWGGDFQEIMKSINNKLLILDDKTIIIPGHGDNSKIGLEKQSNPFL